MSDLNHAILNLVDQEKSIKDEEIYNRIKNSHWDLCQNFNSSDDFKNRCLRSMRKIGFISVEKDTGICRVGSQWKLIQQYEQIMKEVLDKADRQRLTIEKLVSQEDWITMQEIQLN